MEYKELQPVLNIKLDKIRENYLFIKKQLASGVSCAAVVKADSYGLGVSKIAPELYKAGCREFYVAYAQEGIVLREALGNKPADIFVLNGFSDLSLFEEYKLIPVLNNLESIEHWSGFNKNIPVVLQLDTGMNRLGLSADDVNKLKSHIEILESLDVRYVMSHLACADQKDLHKNEEQLASFKQLVAELGVSAPLSFANSSGVFLGADYHFDQVRPGCAIYGINPETGMDNKMQGVIELEATIIQIRQVKAGETVGYGANYLVKRATNLATISVGYADGFFLLNLADRCSVFIAGHECPIVGKVSMDLIVADLSSLEVLPKIGDMVEIIGNHQTVSDLAKHAGTIGYEILTSLGKRYKRNYLG